MVLFVPIFLGGLIKGFGRLAGSVLSTVGNVVPLPGAGVLRFAGRALTSATTTRLPQLQQPQVQQISLPPGLTPRGPGGLIGLLPGVQGGVSGFAQNGQGCPTHGNACSCGCVNGRRAHVNKSGYYVQAQPGNPEAGGVWVASGSKCVANRTRSNFNGRANQRALNRLVGWSKADKRFRKAVAAAARVVA